MAKKKDPLGNVLPKVRSLVKTVQAMSPTEQAAMMRAAESDDVGATTGTRLKGDELRKFKAFLERVDGNRKPATQAPPYKSVAELERRAEVLRRIAPELAKGLPAEIKRGKTLLKLKGGRGK
jgi:hypothetical protein